MNSLIVYDYFYFWVVIFHFRFNYLDELFLGMFLSSKIKYIKMLGKLNPPFLYWYFSYYAFTNCRRIHLVCDNLGFVCMCSLLGHKKVSSYCNICDVLCYVFENSGLELTKLFVD